MASEPGPNAKDVIVNVLDTIAFLLVIPEVLVRVRPWLERATSAAWRTAVFILFFLILIFADEIWVDVLPWWILVPAFAGLIVLMATDSKAYTWLFDKHEDISKWVAEKALWIGVFTFIISRLISIFM